MEVIEIARKLSELQQVSDAQNAYFLVLQQSDKDIERYEAALYLLYTGANKKISYTVLLDLYKKGMFVDEIMKNMMDFALVPEISKMEKRYTKNVELLSKYKYIFRNDFKAFEDLNKRFFKIDDNGYVSFNLEKGEFGEYQPIYLQEVQHYFFKDLDNPIKAEGIYSQYELEYLYDNVRKSEWIARDNHIYLFYSNFEEFENYLQIIDFSEILKDQKFVFLFDDEREMYPIDFKEKYGIDYSTYSIKNVSVKEITRLIYAHQLSSHNGGDFFNEIFDGHPNILSSPSIFLDTYKSFIKNTRQSMNATDNKKYTDKDIIVMMILENEKNNLDNASRITPIVYLQPHFKNIFYKLTKTQQGIIPSCDEIEDLVSSKFLNEFKYVKTFVPMRRITTSYAATVRFGLNKELAGTSNIISSLLTRLSNTGMYVDKNSILFRDSRIVRFEDGKLNPKATFTALSEFLDIPYTDSMKYCSLNGEINPESLKGNAIGFDSSSVYKTYDEFTDDYEKMIIEKYFEEPMKKYGYEFQTIKDLSIDEDDLFDLVDKRHTYLKLKTEQMISIVINTKEEILSNANNREQINSKIADLCKKQFDEENQMIKELIHLKLINTPYIDSEGTVLELMEPLKLDESLLEQPLYR